MGAEQGRFAMKTFSCALLMVLMLTLSSLAQPAADRREALLRSARAHAAAAQFNDAIGRYNEILAENPEDAATLRELGAILLKAGRADEGVVTLAESIRLRPNQPETIRLLADGCLARKDPAGAIEIMELAVMQYPRDVAMRLKLAEVYDGAGRKAEAIRQYQQVLAQAPENASATQGLLALGALTTTTLPPTTTTTVPAPTTTTTAKPATTTLPPKTTTTTLKVTTTTVKATTTTARATTTTAKATTTASVKKSATTTTLPAAAAVRAVPPSAPGAKPPAESAAEAAARVRYEDSARAKEVAEYEKRREAAAREAARKAQYEQNSAAREARERAARIEAGQPAEVKARAAAERKIAEAESAEREARRGRTATPTTTQK